MSGFKDMIAADIDKVFLNLEDYAEEHDLNGTTCSCILQDVSVTEDLSIDELMNQSYPGLYGSRVLVNCKTSDLLEVPVTDQRFRVDDMGMLTIQLVANER